ncbi:hydrolase [Subtercola boreus]|uniref:Hydrolase n=1 Tax=Subtercola boreus TaxID=120213 RepID=A0A3E0VL18_9MICO|nr:alpha/beta fold hydrolase [Subtercola boreus]RFA09567.1 hydrolase [Subtercola boreus]TQL53360.1 acyl-CoA synthetase (AMP-forming)/AMP-acid ligase II [Subtercola boreus]
MGGQRWREPASLPGGFPGLDARWSRLVTAPDSHGTPRTWHLLDNLALLTEAGLEPSGTILCVHGNPTWSYLWRTVVAAATDAALADAALNQASAAPVWRVVAVDQLEMGFSERSGHDRGLPERIADLGALTDTLGLAGPVVTLGHDWGGVVSLGWAVDHPDLLAGVMMLNTAVHQPENAPLPAALRLVLKRSLLVASTVRTTAFLDTTLAIAHPALESSVRSAFRAPYRSARRREGIGAFVADIPVDASHPSFAELTRVSSAVARLDVPALMLWGPRDPVFSDRYLGDLLTRLPHADVTRFEGAGHLVGEDVAVAPMILSWLTDRFRGLDVATDASADSDANDVAGLAVAAHEGPGAAAAPSADRSSEPPAAPFRPLWATLDEHATDPRPAVVEIAPRGAKRGSGIRSVSWALLKRRVDELAAGLTAVGVERGDRVSLLVPPGADLTGVLYACLRIGAVVVVADAGLGIPGLSRAVRGARPDHVIGIETALAAARVLGWPGQRISARTLSAPLAAALGVSHSLANVARLGREAIAAGGAALRPAAPAATDPDATAAILFTSGSTGPAKGVVYTHRQLAALVGLLGDRFGISPGTGLVAGFAPFALLGPALGATSVTPDMDVTSPKTLSARAIAQAARAVDATVVFASPAALMNVTATSDALTAPERSALSRVRTLLSAGAPLPVPLLQEVAALLPEASIHTPYGMTEGLLMTDITLDGIVEAQADAQAGIHAAAQAEARAGAQAGTPAPTPGGVCVGAPVEGVRVLLSALDDHGDATGEPSAAPGVTGEIVVSAPHLKDHYDQLWLTDRAATRETPAGRWHRTGDVGHFDAQGRLWVEGRLPHVITTAMGILTPVGPEQAVEALTGVRRAAFVGIGPRGTQQVVAVIESSAPRARRTPVGLAEPSLATAVRRASGVDVAAVLVVSELPTDIRHNSKIDRTALGTWAAGVLAGGRRVAP